MSSWTLRSLYHTVINASDLDASVAFYETLGFRVLDDRRDAVWPDFVAKNFGLRRAQGKGVLMVLPSDPDGPMLDVIQWVEPELSAGVDASVPDEEKVPRILAFRVENARAAYDALRARGVAFTNEFTGPFEEYGVLGVCCCKDPDGTVIELIELAPGRRHSAARGDAAS